MSFIINKYLLMSLFVCYTGLAIMGGVIVGYFVGRYRTEKRNKQMWFDFGRRAGKNAPFKEISDEEDLK